MSDSYDWNTQTEQQMPGGATIRPYTCGMIGRQKVLFPQPVPPLDETKEPFVDFGGVIDLALAAWACNYGVCILGPPGVGKTTAARIIAARHGAPLQVIQGNRDLSPTDVFGCRPRLGAPDEMLVASPALVAALHGSALLIDELGKVEGERALALFASLGDSRRCTDSDMAGAGIEAASSFRLIATMNPSDPPLSSWLEERFLVKIEIGFPTAEQLAKVVAAHRHNGTLLEAFRSWGRGRQGISARRALAIVRFAEARQRMKGGGQPANVDARKLIEEAASLISPEGL
jgi:midasin (ATPase involved in ribosome maturation)